MSNLVALVHGFATSSARTWGENGWLDLLGDVGRTPLPIDLLGHGTADKPHDPAAYDAMEDLVRKQLPDEPIDAIGFSLGARVLLTIVCDHPDRFERLVLTGVGANLLRSDSSDVVRQAIEGEGDATNPVVQYFAGLASHPDADRAALSACIQSPRPPLTRERLATVQLPVLVIIGDKDFAGPGEPLAEALPQATLVTLRNVDHFATPKDFGCIDAALDFLGAAPPDAPRDRARYDVTFVLGVDLDGVCGDYTAAFRAVVAADRGVDPADLTDARSWDFAEWGVDSAEEFDRLHRVAVLEHRMFRHMPPMPGVAESLWRLSDAGVWIRIITHRLCVNWGHAVAVADTVAWLDETGIPYRDICFLGAKPEVEADSYVDDASHNVTALRAAGNRVIVYDAPYNRDVEGPRATTWAEVEDLVMAQVAELGVPLQAQLPGLDAGADRLTRRLIPPGG